MSPAYNSAEQEIVEPKLQPARPDRLVPKLRYELLRQVDEKGQVIVHCTVTGDGTEQVRIWPTTFLVCRRTGIRSRLLFAEGIVMPPEWMPLRPTGTARFTLIFSALPQQCVLFDLVEEIPEHGAFSARGILRNSMDVYRVGLE